MACGKMFLQFGLLFINRLASSDSSKEIGYKEILKKRRKKERKKKPTYSKNAVYSLVSNEFSIGDASIASSFQSVVIHTPFDVGPAKTGVAIGNP
jgi:hypothetical protein